MKKIPVNWLCGVEVGAAKVTLRIGAAELPGNLNSIFRKGPHDARSLSQIKKMSMEQLRHWEKFPVRILRSL
jgi:hypothetical protein